MSLISADATDESGLRLLDEALRQDVPGTDGWINDPQEFREHTFDERRFDPATYLVAVDDLSRAFAGLARVRDRGISEVSADADADAANALLTGIGARRVGGSIELVRRAPH